MTLAIDVFRSPVGQQFRAFALAATAFASVSPGVLAASRPHPASHSSSIHNSVSRPSDFDCAVHTAMGEAPWGDVVEAAVIINGLLISARGDGISVCAESYRRYAPKYGNADWAVRAAINVFNQGASLVPKRFCRATEFRSAWYPLLRNSHYVLVGQLSRGGNRFYEPVL